MPVKTPQHFNQLMQIMKEFETFAGLRVNFKKSLIILSEQAFSQGTWPPFVEGVPVKPKGKYLGIMVGQGVTEEDNWQPIGEKRYLSIFVFSKVSVQIGLSKIGSGGSGMFSWA